MKSIRWYDLLEARSDFRRTWPQLLLTDLLARTIVVVVVAPMIGLLVNVFLFQTDDGVLRDSGTIMFLFHFIFIFFFSILTKRVKILSSV